MGKPNLFQIATKELSQDGFFTWLIQWADSTNEKYDQELSSTAKSFVKLLSNNTADILSVSTERQWNNIDILVEVNDDMVIAIEDKINSSEHSEQLERYKQIVKEHYKNKRTNLFFVYLKTGNESRATTDEIRKKGYVIIDRKAVLEILNSCNSKNDILIEFRDYLNTIELRSNSFIKYENIVSDGKAAEGFYLKLQELIPEWSSWGYVPNQTGGFLGFWYHWTSPGNYRLYIQIENAFDDGIKLVVKIGDWDQSIDTLYSVFSELQTTANQYGLNLIKPDRYRTGKTSTLAIVENAFLSKPDGTFDINQFHEILEKLEKILDTHTARTKAPA
jgi:hypothetical protein